MKEESLHLTRRDTPVTQNDLNDLASSHQLMNGDKNSKAPLPSMDNILITTSSPNPDPNLNEIPLELPTKKLYSSKRAKCLIFLAIIFIFCGLAITAYFLYNFLIDKQQNDYRFPFLSKEEAQKVISFYEADTHYKTLPEKQREHYLQGYYKQFLLSPSRRLLSEDTSDVVKFTPENISDSYFLIVNSTKTKEKKLQAEENDYNFTETADSNGDEQKIEHYKIEYIVFNSTNESIFIWVTLENVTRKGDETDETESETESNTEATKVLSMEELITVWEDPDHSKRTSLFDEMKEEMIIHMISCKLLRIGGIETCDKPNLLKNETYETIINGLYLYFPDFRARHANIFYNGEINKEKETDKTYNTENGEQLSQEINVQITNKETLSTSFEKQIAKEENQTAYLTKTNYVSSTMVDPYTGRILQAKSITSFKMFPREKNANLSQSDQDFINDLQSNTEIATFYNETRKVEENELEVLRDYWGSIVKVSIYDPINNMTKTDSDIANNSNSTFSNITNRRLLRSGQIVAEQSFDILDTRAAGIRFISDMNVKCYYDNYCYPVLKLDISGLAILYHNFDPIKIYAVQRFYKGFSFLKVVVLDNIIRLSSLAEEIIGNIGDIVSLFLYTSKNIVNGIYKFWELRKDELHNKLNQFTYNLLEMLNFTKVIFPVINQEMVQMFKDIMGNIEIELNSEYSIYYNKIQNVLPSLQAEYQNYQQKLPYVKIPQEDLAKILNIIDNVFMKNYDNVFYEMGSELFKWEDRISHWTEHILDNITDIIPKNDIFHFQEAFTKLSQEFLKYINIETEQSDFIQKTTDELNTSYINYKNLYKTNYNFQRQLLLQNLNDFKTLVSQNIIPTETNFSDNFKENLYQSSVFLNETQLERLFVYQKSLELENRLQEIIKNRVNVTFGSIKRQMEAKFNEFLRNFIDFYDEIKKTLFELLEVILAKDYNNFKSFEISLKALVEKLKKFIDLVKSMFNRLMDPIFRPKREEIIEMKKINLFKVAEYIEETFQSLLKVKEAFLLEIKAIPHKLYLLSQRNVSRLLELKTLRMLQSDLTADDQRNLYDKILERISEFLAPVIVKGDYVLELFQLATKYLENDEDSFSKRMFGVLQEKIVNFIENHNRLVRLNITTTFSPLYGTIEVYFTSIQILRGPLRLLLPPDGVNKLIDLYTLISLTYRQPLAFAGYSFGFFKIGISLSLIIQFKMYVNAEWGWIKNKEQGKSHGELFIRLIPSAEILAGFIAEASFIFVRFSVGLNIILIKADIPVKFTLNYEISSERFFCRSLLKVDLFLYPLSIEHWYEYQFLELRWIRIRIKLWFVKFWIWILWPQWGRKHSMRYFHPTVSYHRNLMEKELFKKDIYYLDKVEEYLVDALGI